MKEIREKVYKLSKEIWIKLFNIKKEDALKFLAENWLPEYLKNEKRVQVISEFCLKTKEEYEYFIEDENLRKKFWNSFSSLPQFKRDFLIQYRLKNIPKEYFWKYNTNEIYKLLNWEKYEWFKTAKINFLKSKWVKIEIIPSWLREEKFNIQMKFLNKSYEEYQLFLKSKFYFKIYWHNFKWIPAKIKYEFLKNHNSTPLFLKWKSIKDVIGFYNKTEEEYKKYLLEKEYKKHFSQYFWCLIKNNKEILLNYWMVKNKNINLLDFVKFISSFEWFWEKEYLEHMEFKKNFWFKYHPYEKHIKIQLIKFWYENFSKLTEWYWNKKDRIYFFLLEQKHWFKFNTLNWKIICEFCWNEIKFSKAVFDRSNQQEDVNIKHLCLKCSPKKKKSLKEMKFFQFLKETYKWRIFENFKYEKIFEWRRKNSKEFDIFLPDENIAIEYNWSYHHRNEKINHKYNYCTENNINLIIVWEHKEEEWKEIINNLLKKKEFTEEIITLENMYYNITPKGYVKIWEISQTFEIIWRHKVYNLWKTIYKKGH